MAQRTTYDALIDLINPLPKEAEAAPWKSVLELIMKHQPAVAKSLSKADKAALELLTEAYPSVKLTGVRAIPGPGGWYKPRGVYTDIDDFVKGMAPATIELPIEIGAGIPRLYDMASTYAHEGSHALTGGSSAYLNWLEKFGGPFSRSRQSARAAIEGFAEGSGNALLDRYNKNVSGWYWPNKYRKSPIHEQYPYLKAGPLGREVGESLREGAAPKQRAIIEELMALLKQYL